MKSLWLSFAMILAFGLALASCSKLDFLMGAINPSSAVSVFTKEGESYRVVSISSGSAPRMRNIYFVGGSGCASLEIWLATYFKDLPPGFTVHAVEKTGVAPRSLGARCSQAFWNTYDRDTLVQRNLVAMRLLERANENRFDAIIGTSEGGVIAPELALRHPSTAKLVLIGAGGMTQREELQFLAQQGSRLPIPAALRAVAVAPNSTTDRALGLPHRYWSSFLDYDPAATLAGLAQETLIVIGENDSNVPPISAQRAVDTIRRAKLRVIDDADHVFTGKRAEVMAEIAQFLTAE